jgi:spermidine/putrescine transport system permease protein
MLFLLITPEIVLCVALFLVFAYLLQIVPLGTVAQILGHSTFTISYVVIIVRGRLFALGREYEEAARDLGASAAQALEAGLAPHARPGRLGMPCDCVRDLDRRFRDQLLPQGWAATETIPTKLYSGLRLAPSPALNAIATILLALSMLAITAAALFLNRLGKRDGTKGSAIEDSPAWISSPGCCRRYNSRWLLLGTTRAGTGCAPVGSRRWRPGPPRFLADSMTAGMPGRSARR